MPLHQFTTGVQAPFGFQPTVPYPVDSWSGPYSAGSTTAAVSLANSTVPDAIRFLSLEVRILAPNPGSPGQTLAYKYWYRGSTANDGLVEFSSASSTDSGVTLAVAGAGIVLSPAGGTGTVTFINNGVLSFNGKTGAVSGASLGANTFSELNTFNAGITTAFLYASTGSTFGGTLRVNGGATFGARVDVGGILDVVGGVTLETTLDVGGAARFAVGSTFSGIAAFTSGITTSNIYASTGSTFGGTLVVNGGATFATTDHAGVARFAAGLTTSTLDVVGAARFAGGSTFSGIAAFTSGITTSSIYASTGSTFGARVDVAGILDVVGGTTLENTLDVGGVARFAVGITTSTLNASAAIRANGGLTASTLDVEGVSKFAGGATFSSPVDFASAARFAVGLTSSGDVVVGSAGTVLKTNGDATIGATLNVNGNFYVTGTITTVNQANLSIDDKTITLGRTLDNDSLADGGGLILNSATDRTLTWNLASDAWTSSVNYRVLGSNGYKVDSTTVLASGMVHGLSASGGIITGGTWEAKPIGLTYGGTNKNLAAVGGSGGVVFKDSTGLSITSAGTYNQILQVGHPLSGGAPVWANTTSLTGITADSVRTLNNNTAGTYYLTFVTGAANSTDLYVDTAAGVTYNAASGVLSCVQLEAIVDGGTW